MRLSLYIQWGAQNENTAFWKETAFRALEGNKEQILWVPLLRLVICMCAEPILKGENSSFLFSA